MLGKDSLGLLVVRPLHHPRNDFRKLALVKRLAEALDVAPGYFKALPVAAGDDDGDAGP